MTRGVLSPREMEVLRFASEGMTVAQTAEWLEIAVSTVRTHRMTIMRKFHVHTITGAVGHAYRSGVLK